MEKLRPKFSLIILTFNRPDRVVQQLECLENISRTDLEIIIVDNCSEQPVTELVPENKDINIVRNERNLGAVGRNKGLEVAKGEFIITLDDDVYGLSNDAFDVISHLFERTDLAAINFRIEEEGTGNITDWCHPCDSETWVDKELMTNDISEGAVVFRKSALELVGLYPDSFFISHEGPDLAFRLINNGWQVIYTPLITVVHGYEQIARKSWRRYYYDTRNQLWFVLRNLTFSYGAKRLLIGWGSIFIYSLRDGYFRYWVKAICDSLLGAPLAIKQRVSPTPDAIKCWAIIERNKPGFWVMVRRRLFKKEVRI